VNQGGSKIRSTTISLPSDTAMRLQQASRGVNLPVAPTTANPTTNTAVAPQMSTPADAGSIHSPLLPADGSLTTGKAGANSNSRDSGRKVFGLPGSLK
jgi:hypothetical protein